MMIVSSGDIARVDAVMHTGLKRHMSIKAIVELFRKAVEKGYAAKSFTEHEMGLGLLFLCLGGTQLASIAHRALGMPAVTTIQHAQPTKPLCISSHLPTTSKLVHNISVSLTAGLFGKDDGADLMKKLESSTYVLMFNEVKIEETPCYNMAGNSIVGICQEHSALYSLEYTSEHKAYRLFEGVKDGNVHIETEVSACMIYSVCFSD